MSFLSHNPGETQEHARIFAEQCQPGTVVRLHGTLGAGKTTWVQGFVRGMGCLAEATSPTFSLLHEYRQGRLDIYHWDLYRLDPETDWSVLDLPDQLPSPGVTLVEWPDRYPGPWPVSGVRDVRITLTKNDTRRIETDNL